MLNNIHLHKNQNIQHFKNFMSFHFKTHFSSNKSSKKKEFQKICLKKITDTMSSSKIQQCSKLKITVTFKKPFSGM